MLIEHAIKSYNAKQIKSTDVEGILSETESALINRLESRFDEMSKRTIERMAGLLFTNTFDTVKQSLLVEQLHKVGVKTLSNSKAKLTNKQQTLSQNDTKNLETVFFSTKISNL